MKTIYPVLFLILLLTFSCTGGKRTQANENTIDSLVINSERITNSLGEMLSPDAKEELSAWKEYNDVDEFVIAYYNISVTEALNNADELEGLVKLMKDSIRIESLKKDDVILFRIEQLYPFPAKTLVKELKPYAKNAKFYWCQEEPKNMGGWFSVRDYIQWTLETINANNSKISYIGRSPDASPATGYAKRHISQQQEIINKVFE